MHTFLRGIIPVISAVLFLAGCDRSGSAPEAKREFTVRGIVRGTSPDGQTLDIQHEAIPNYMPEMTMPFALKDPKEAGRVKIGDAISFRFVVDETTAVIDRIEKIALEQVQVAAVATAPPGASSSGRPRLKAGDMVPPFTLTNENGETITLETFRGRSVVLTFIFTRCPVPNYCPLMSRNFALFQEAIRGGGSDSLGQTRLLSISFDPAHDTPAVLKDYAMAQRADPAVWSFATGTPPQVEDLTRQFAVMIQPEGGTISHGLATALLDGDGKVVEIWRGNGWKAAEVIEKIAKLPPR